MAADASSPILRPLWKTMECSEILPFQNLKTEGKYFEQTLFEHLNVCQIKLLMKMKYLKNQKHLKN